MNSDRFIRVLREDPTVLPSFEAFVSSQEAKISHRLALCDDEHEIFRLQGEIRCLTNIVSRAKTELGVAQNNGRDLREIGKFVAKRDG